MTPLFSSPNKIYESSLIRYIIGKNRWKYLLKSTVEVDPLRKMTQIDHFCQLFIHQILFSSPPKEGQGQRQKAP